jgi:Flp pilus assembly protein TadD
MQTAIIEQLSKKKERQHSGTLSVGVAFRALHQGDTADPAALHALGLSAMRENNFALAAAKFAQAIDLAGPVAEYCHNLARALHAGGKFRQAATCYEQAIAGQPGKVQLYLELARVLIQDGRGAEAVTVLQRALGLTPHLGEAWALLGGVLNLSGHAEQAAEALREAIRLDPGQAAFHYDLGLVLCRVGDLEKSEAAYRCALQLNPKFPEALNNLGNVLQRNKNSVEAVSCFRRALRYLPDYPDAQYNLGLALQSLDRLEDAESCYRSVLKAAPAHHAASNNYGNVLMGQGRIPEAMSRYEHAMQLAPANREYRVNTAMAQLLEGNFLEGWRNYGWRPKPAVPGGALWTGQPLNGSSILLLSEQGLGDTIQFIRYAHHVKYLGGHVQALCPEPLVELIRTAPGVGQAIAADREFPSCDWYAPLLHLPAVFGTRIDTIPSNVPYLSADPVRGRAWEASLDIPATHLRVGIVWRGGTDHWNDRNRSMDPSFLAVLEGVPATTFVSLQKGYREGCKGLTFAPLHRDLMDFADTAALMAQLDLVISVDTSVAHLAGALGLPTWVLLPFAPDWRWMRGRADSPWYPDMKLFRQERRGKWLPVLKKVREALLQVGRESGARRIKPDS